MARFGEAYFKNVIGLMILSKCFEDFEKKYEETSESFKNIVCPLFENFLETYSESRKQTSLIMKFLAT